MGKESRPDVVVHRASSILLLEPVTEPARAWLDAHAEASSWQWIAGRLAVDARVGGPLLEALSAAGYVVEGEA